MHPKLTLFPTWTPYPGVSVVNKQYSCRDYAYELAKLVAEVYLAEKCDCILLSGGIDTSFITLSLILHGIKPKAITVLYDVNSDDYSYVLKVSEKLGLNNVQVIVRKEVSEYLVRVLEIFKTIDPIEVVCGIPLYIGLVEAKKQGCKCIMTGDGGDELFFGYAFLLNKCESELEEWIKYVIDKRFSSEIIGAYIGLKVIPAFYHKRVVNYSINIPINCKVGKYRGRKWGKLLLRLFLEEHGLEEIAWRNKTPINIGSGFNKLLHEWSNNVSLIEVLELYRKSLIHFPSRPHAYLYSKIIELEGIEIPGRCRYKERACPICGRCINGKHCMFCGASINDDGKILVYSDELYHEIRRIMSA